MRVLMLNYEFPPVGGGSAGATRQLLAEFARREGVEVDLVTCSATNEFERESFSDSIELHRVPVAKQEHHFWTMAEIARWTRAAWPLARELAEEGNYDLCHCWSGWPSGVIGHGLRRQLPYLVALRGSDVPGYNPRLRLLDPLFFQHLSRRVWRRAGAVTCLSYNQLGAARRTLPDLQARVVRNGIDAEVFRPGPRRSRFTVLFVGRLIERKRVADLVDAFARIPSHPEPAELVIVGSGPEQARLEARCRRQRIGDRVRFLGEVAHERLPAIYADASVFVTLAQEEALGNVVLEAMASGLPVISTDTGASEVIEDAGTIVDRGDRGQIRRAIERYRSEPELLAAHGARARALAERRTWASVATAYLELYDRVVEGRSAARADR